MASVVLIMAGGFIELYLMKVKQREEEEGKKKVEAEARRIVEEKEAEERKREEEELRKLKMEYLQEHMALDSVEEKKKKKGKKNKNPFREQFIHDREARSSAGLRSHNIKRRY